MKKMLIALFVLLTSVANAMDERSLGSLARIESKPMITSKPMIALPTNPAFMDKELRLMPKDKLAQLISADKVYLSKTGNTVHLNHRVNGGGAGGAWLGMITGKIVVHGLAQLGIGLVSFGAATVAGIASGGNPVAISLAAKGTYFTLNTALLPTVEAASNVVAVGGGILGGVVTGPA